MQLLAMTTLIIERSVDQVFPYVSNMENYIEWFPGVVSIESVNELPHGAIGKTYRETLYLPEGKVNLIINVKESVINSRLRTEGDLAPIYPSMLMEFKKMVNGETEFSLSYYSRNLELAANNEMFEALRHDLAERIAVAEINLRARFKVKR